MQITAGADGAGYYSTKFAQFRVGRPIPADQSSTQRFAAGTVTIGVEHRMHNERILGENYGPERAKEMMVEQYGSNPLEHPVADEGLSIHIFDTATGTEHLRFDDLEANKHYHYMTGDGHHALVAFDYVANGPFLPWVFRTLKTHAEAMLSFAGADALAESLDRESLGQAIAEAERLVTELST